MKDRISTQSSPCHAGILSFHIITEQGKLLYLWGHQRAGWWPWSTLLQDTTWKPTICDVCDYYGKGRFVCRGINDWKPVTENEVHWRLPWQNISTLISPHKKGNSPYRKLLTSTSKLGKRHRSAVLQKWWLLEVEGDGSDGGGLSLFKRLDSEGLIILQWVYR